MYSSAVGRSVCRKYSAMDTFLLFSLISPPTHTASAGVKFLYLPDGCTIHDLYTTSTPRSRTSSLGIGSCLSSSRERSAATAASPRGGDQIGQRKDRPPLDQSKPGCSTTRPLGMSGK